MKISLGNEIRDLVCLRIGELPEFSNQAVVLAHRFTEDICPNEK